MKDALESYRNESARVYAIIPDHKYTRELKDEIDTFVLKVTMIISTGSADTEPDIKDEFENLKKSWSRFLEA